MDNSATIQVFKCPSCGGALHYDAEGGSLACMWCGNSYDATNLEAKQVSSSLQGYLCPECGARLMTDDYIAADTCPYCGNNEIAPQRFEGEFEPDYVIPFSITKQQAIERYNDAVAQKKYLPDDFAAEARIISTQGTYVPFWLESGRVEFDYTFKAWYTEKKNGKKTNYISDQHRVGTYTYARVPADGSERMSDDMMDSVEPYDLEALVPFSTGYLPGFMAERYTIDVAGVEKRLRVRVAGSAIHAAMDTISDKFDLRYPDNDRMRSIVYHDRAEQALFPVWLFVVAYEGEKYLVGVNGQTGKVAVNLPIDEKKRDWEATKAGIRGAAPLVSVLLVVLASLIATLIGVKGLNGLGEFFGALFDGTLLAELELHYQIIFGILAAGFVIGLVIAAVMGFRSGKRKVLDSMHNVKEALDADAYDVGGLTITVSEAAQGPLRDDASAGRS